MNDWKDISILSCVFSPITNNKSLTICIIVTKIMTSLADKMTHCQFTSTQPVTNILKLFIWLFFGFISLILKKWVVLSKILVMDMKFYSVRNPKEGTYNLRF